MRRRCPGFALWKAHFVYFQDSYDQSPCLRLRFTLAFYPRFFWYETIRKILFSSHSVMGKCYPFLAPVMLIQSDMHDVPSPLSSGSSTCREGVSLGKRMDSRSSRLGRLKQIQIFIQAFTWFSDPVPWSGGGHRCATARPRLFATPSLWKLSTRFPRGFMVSTFIGG